ncbi:MAG TPA: TatD family hydrolase [Actinomycetota bacterium]|nr:TatD family hydrolase [Actinomycetota bacterium]
MSDPSDALERAASAGVEMVLTVGSDLETSRQNVSIASRYSNVYAAVGVHPHDAETLDEVTLGEIRALALTKGVVAIGEIGLDYFRDLSPRAQQREAFERQLTLARELSMPVVIHVREAFDDVISILGSHPGPVVFHCFSEGPDQVLTALEADAFISFAGNISYKSAEKLRDAARVVPLDRLLIETDSPYLAPAPHRGKPNEPSFVPFVGQAVAEAKDMSPEEIAATTRRNFRTAFEL